MRREAWEKKDGDRRLLEQIDAELRASLAVEPSPWFLPRVRRRVAAPAPIGRSRAVWLVMAAMLAGAVAGVTVLGRTAPVPPPAAPAVAVLVGEARGARVPSIPRAVSSTPELAQVPGRLRSAVPRRRPDAEVVVPPGQEVLLRRYVDAMSPLELAETDGDPAVEIGSRELGDIAIASIEIRPLTLEPLSEE